MSDQRRPPVLITDIINRASSQLREAGIETPEHDAKLLLAEAAGVELRDVDRALLMGEELGTTGQLAVSTAVPSASRCNTSPGMLLSATLT